MGRLAGALLVVIVAALPWSTARAATLTVNSLDDAYDGACDASHCSLREAIQTAGDNDTIVFALTVLPAEGPVIYVETPLPWVYADGVTIDGYQCSGCGAVSENTNDPLDGLNLLIGPTLDGTNMYIPGDIVRVGANDVTIRGLNIRNASGGAGILAGWGDNVTIEGCLIGTDRTGSVAQPNLVGIEVTGHDDNVIGPYNLVSGNSSHGLVITGSRPDEGLILANLIGTDIAGASALGNGGHGIAAIGPTGSPTTYTQDDWTVGGTTLADANLISGNAGSGIYQYARTTDWQIDNNVIGVNGSADAPVPNGEYGVHVEGTTGARPANSEFTSNIIAGNTLGGVLGQASYDQTFQANSIGTDPTGTLDLGNGGDGILLTTGGGGDTEEWLIGGLTVAEANTIAFNDGDGIRLSQPSSTQENRLHSILVNSWHDNDGLAVDLESGTTGDGPALPTALQCGNDVTFGNRGMGRPVIDTAALSGTELTVSGQACPVTWVGVWIADPDATGFGEPAEFLGAVTANASGVWEYTEDPTTVTHGDALTAMHYDLEDLAGNEGETGEASENVSVTGCDVDGDGFASPTCGGDDCDDTDPAINPGATEVCNGLDDDCDTEADEGFDADADSFTTCDGDCDDNDPNASPGLLEVCDGVDNDCDGVLPTTEGDDDTDGFMVCSGDCDDTDAAIYPGAVEVCNGLDDDCDTAVDEGFDVDGDGVTTCDGDCDDTDPAINPAATEVCNGVDDDCDTTADEGFDADADSFTTCDGDCDDNDPAINPGATEVCNGLDDDCDTEADEGFDADADSFTTCDGDCDDNDPNASPGLLEVCDGVDNDCDGVLPAFESDDDADGFMVCLGDCDDADAAIYPGAVEVCNGLDDDCDIAVDEGFDADGDGVTTCDGDCDDTDPAINPAAIEVCNSVDDDCDTTIDEGFDADGDGYTPCSGDCDDADATRHPGAPELCDGLDNDCDGQPENGNDDNDGDGYEVCAGDCDDADPSSYPGAVEACDGADNDCDGVLPTGEVDADGDGVLACGGDCDDTEPTTFPGAVEICDGVDNDCDATVPADEADADGDGFRLCMGDCDDLEITAHPGATELCDGIDNDCDGVVPLDELDADGDGSAICAGDCDDNDPSSYPGATETCDGIDNDCDGAVPPDEQDLDGDGFRLCDSDCDDTDATLFPGNPEACDGLDNDCDGAVPPGEQDLDGDGFRLCDGDCNDSETTTWPGAPEACDSIDSDCDGDLVDDFDDADGDGLPDCPSEDGDGDGDPDITDCAPLDPTVYTGAAEIPDDNIDQDCDGVDATACFEDFDEDGFGSLEVIVADDGDCDDVGESAVDTDCDDGEPDVHPGAEELCNGGVDDDCLPATDEEGDLDGDGFSLCDGDCDDEEPAVFPEAPELCDGLDNDCDADTVEDEADEDGDGWRLCDGDCDDDDELVWPGAPELCDGIDNDCDSEPETEAEVDFVDWFEDLDGDGFGDDATSLFDCAQPDGFVATGGDCDDADEEIHPDAVELCDGIDNDCDPSTDLDGTDFDADLDGVLACAGDCDDSDPDVYPAAPELCGDDIDQDCDGTEADGGDPECWATGCEDCSGEVAPTSPTVPWPVLFLPLVVLRRSRRSVIRLRA